MNAFQKNKPFFIFLLKFGGTYLVLALIYSFYLSRFDEARLEPDGVTHVVARQSAWLSTAFGEEAHIDKHPAQACYRYYIHDVYKARIVEGCNAVSIMILFAAFIVAFSTTFKRTAIYIVAGVVVIHVLNILRIALINIGGYYYPDWEHFLHDVVFPLFIYGVVVVLWVLWVAKFRGNAKR